MKLYGAEYQHAHKFEEAAPEIENFQGSLVTTMTYEPSGRERKKRISQRLQRIGLASKKSPRRNKGKGRESTAP
jgi:replication-associated recombination protein RarA